MNFIQIPCDTSQVSDGYHTFGELYEHRCLLFLALMKQRPDVSWISNMHHDGSSFDGWFIAGMSLPTGDITYHCPNSFWPLANKTGAEFLPKAPQWDGHTPHDVLVRIRAWIGNT
jgi:hypothetical protein